jgi:hypothetical protein
MSEVRRQSITIDFDGVIHNNLEGWKDGAIYGDVVPGFFEWAEKAAPHFDLIVYSARSAHHQQIYSMAQWMHAQLLRWKGGDGDPGTSVLDMNAFKFATHKVHSCLTIDDMGFRFMGDWKDPALEPSAILASRGWNERDA